LNNSTLCVRRAHLQFGVAALFLFFCICAYLLSQGEFVAVVSWLFVIIVFMPAFLASRLVKSTLLQMVIGIAFITQFISVPIFVITRDSYTPSGWTAVKDFSFTVPEFATIYSHLAFFLVVVVCCIAALIRMVKLPQLPASRCENRSAQKQSIKRNTNYYLLLLILVIFLIVPLNLWMFSSGISLTGIEPPRLPFRLSGILSYLTSYAVPLVLAILYSKTTRAYVPAIILMVYALLLGACHISKGVLMFTMLPVVYCAISDRKYVIFSLSAIFSLASIQLVSLLRNVVYVVVGGKSGSDTANGLMLTLNRLINDSIEYVSVADIFSLIVNRIESAQDIVLASKFNADAIGGIGPAFLGFNCSALNNFDIDAYHIEFKGISLPEGFGFGAGGMLAKSLLFTQSQPLYIVIFAMNVAAYIYLGEWIARSISRKYSNRAYYPIVGGLYILFLYTNPGSPVFIGMMFFMIIVAMPFFPVRWPKLSVKV